MTDTVRIMEAAMKVDDLVGHWSECSAPPDAKCDQCWEYFEARQALKAALAEVSDPIVWDGSDYEKDFEAWLELSIRIEAELGEGYFVAETWRLDCLGIFRRIPRDQRCDPQDDSVLVGILTPGARIRIEGDSFEILPPEVTA